MATLSTNSWSHLIERYVGDFNTTKYLKGELLIFTFRIVEIDEEIFLLMVGKWIIDLL